MKKISAKIWGVLLVTVFLTTGSVAMAQMEIPMSTVYMNTHPTVVNAWEPWFKEVLEKTGGELKLTYFNPNTLASLPDVFDSTVSGMIGLGGMDCSRNPGKFPLYTVMELPGMAPSAECGSFVVWDLYQKYPEMRNELKEIKVLWQWVSATFQLHTTKKLVENLDDLKGLKIIAWNKTSVNILKALGANAIMLPPTDSYLALERGMGRRYPLPVGPHRILQDLRGGQLHHRLRYFCHTFLGRFRPPCLGEPAGIHAAGPYRHHGPAHGPSQRSDPG